MTDLHVCSVCGERANEIVHAGHSAELAEGPPVRICNGTAADMTFIHVLDNE